MQFEAVLQSIMDLVTRFGFRALGSIAIVLLGFWVIRLAKKPLRVAFSKSGLDETIVQFLVSLIGYALLAFVVIAALGNLGVQTTSFVAVFGAAGLAIGLALEGSLANFAAGILIAFFRPIRLGDFVEAADSEGVVDKITIFHTTIKTLDNETIIVPNSDITSGKVVNYSAEEFVRIEVPIAIGHDVDFAQVRALLEQVPAQCKRVLAEPPAEVQITDLSGDLVQLQLEVSVEPMQREDAGFEVAEKMKQALDEAGIRRPRRALDVQMTQA